jgi:hypothetical protein
MAVPSILTSASRRALLGLLACLPPGAAAAQRLTDGVEGEVRGNVLAQPVGPGTVDDLALPEPFVERVVGRILRASFRERFQRVVPDPVAADAQDGERLPAWVWAAGYGALALAAAGWMARAAARRAT